MTVCNSIVVADSDVDTVSFDKRDDVIAEPEDIVYLLHFDGYGNFLFSEKIRKEEKAD